MTQLQLSNGAYIHVRPMPPHVVLQFNRNVERDLPPEPKAPTQRVKMADGHFEEDVVSEGPEWDAYQEKRDAWTAECDAIIVTANDDYNDLQRDYAVIEWSFNGEHWQKDVPESWKYPEALTRGGVLSCGNERVDFIGIELLTTTEDWALVRGVAEGLSNITDEEAARVRAGFRPGSGRARNTATKKEGWLRRLAKSLSRGDGGGEGVGADARRVVQGEPREPSGDV